MTTTIKLPLRSVNPAVIRDLQEKYPDAELNIEVGSNRFNGLLTEQEFWELIALLDWSKEGDDDAVVKPLVSALAASPIRHIYDFEDILSQKLYALDGLAYAQNIGEDSYHPDKYFSVDAFLYVRCCVVANGKDFYEKVLKNPSLMPKDVDFEALLNVAHDAFERKTGEEMAYLPAYNYETYSNKDGWISAN